jgi:hypothetical protein
MHFISGFSMGDIDARCPNRLSQKAKLDVATFDTEVIPNGKPEMAQ